MRDDFDRISHDSDVSAQISVCDKYRFFFRPGLRPLIERFISGRKATPNRFTMTDI